VTHHARKGGTCKFTSVGIAEFAGLEMMDEVAGVENDGLEFGGLRNEDLKIFQFCKCQSPVTDCNVLHSI